jgi:hypothetical protein
MNARHITHGLHESDRYEARIPSYMDWQLTPMFNGPNACEWIMEEWFREHKDTNLGQRDRVKLFVDFRNQKSGDAGTHSVELKLVPIAQCIDIPDEEQETK